MMRKSVIFGLVLSTLILMLFCGCTQDVENSQEKDVDSEPKKELVDVTLLDKIGYSEEGTITEVVFDVPPDAVSLAVTLSWEDDYGNNDWFEMALLYEGSELAKGNTTTGEIIHNITCSYQGNHSIVITALHCPEDDSGKPFDRDEGNDWHLLVQCVREVLVR